MGSVDKKQTYELLDYFYDQGGNFIDTASNYQFEQSESWIGDWSKDPRNPSPRLLRYTSSSAVIELCLECLQRALHTGLVKLSLDLVNIFVGT